MLLSLHSLLYGKFKFKLVTSINSENWILTENMTSLRFECKTSNLKSIDYSKCSMIRNTTVYIQGKSNKG